MFSEIKTLFELGDRITFKQSFLNNTLMTNPKINKNSGFPVGIIQEQAIAPTVKADAPVQPLSQRLEEATGNLNALVAGTKELELRRSQLEAKVTELTGSIEDLKSQLVTVESAAKNAQSEVERLNGLNEQLNIQLTSLATVQEQLARLTHQASTQQKSAAQIALAQGALQPALEFLEDIDRTFSSGRSQDAVNALRKGLAILNGLSAIPQFEDTLLAAALSVIEPEEISAAAASADEDTTTDKPPAALPPASPSSAIRDFLNSWALPLPQAIEQLSRLKTQKGIVDKLNEVLSQSQLENAVKQLAVEFTRPHGAIDPLIFYIALAKTTFRDRTKKISPAAFKSNFGAVAAKIFKKYTFYQEHLSGKTNFDFKRIPQPLLHDFILESLLASYRLDSRVNNDLNKIQQFYDDLVKNKLLIDVVPAEADKVVAPVAPAASAQPIKDPLFSDSEKEGLRNLLKPHIVNIREYRKLDNYPFYIFELPNGIRVPNDENLESAFATLNGFLNDDTIAPDLRNWVSETYKKLAQDSLQHSTTFDISNQFHRELLAALEIFDRASALKNGHRQNFVHLLEMAKMTSEAFPEKLIYVDLFNLIRNMNAKKEIYIKDVSELLFALEQAHLGRTPRSVPNTLTSNKKCDFIVNTTDGPLLAEIKVMAQTKPTLGDNLKDIDKQINKANYQLSGTEKDQGIRNADKQVWLYLKKDLMPQYDALTAHIRHKFPNTQVVIRFIDTKNDLVDEDFSNLYPKVQDHLARSLRYAIEQEIRQARQILNLKGTETISRKVSSLTDQIVDFLGDIQEYFGSRVLDKLLSTLEITVPPNLESLDSLDTSQLAQLASSLPKLNSHFHQISSSAQKLEAMQQFIPTSFIHHITHWLDDGFDKKNYINGTDISQMDISAFVALTVETIATQQKTLTRTEPDIEMVPTKAESIDEIELQFLDLADKIFDAENTPSFLKESIKLAEYAGKHTKWKSLSAEELVVLSLSLDKIIEFADIFENTTFPIADNRKIRNAKARLFKASTYKEMMMAWKDLSAQLEFNKGPVSGAASFEPFVTEWIQSFLYNKDSNAKIPRKGRLNDTKWTFHDFNIEFVTTAIRDIEAYLNSSPGTNSSRLTLIRDSLSKSGGWLNTAFFNRIMPQLAEAVDLGVEFTGFDLTPELKALRTFGTTATPKSTSRGGSAGTRTGTTTSKGDTVVPSPTTKPSGPKAMLAHLLTEGHLAGNPELLIEGGLALAHVPSPAAASFLNPPEIFRHLAAGDKKEDKTEERPANSVHIRVAPPRTPLHIVAAPESEFIISGGLPDTMSQQLKSGLPENSFLIGGAAFFKSIYAVPQIQVPFLKAF